MKYICKECKDVDPCNLDTGETPNQMPPERCATDGDPCNWQPAEACALAEAAEKEGR